MRTDVKLGVFFSMAIVLVLGGYFVYPRGGGDAIPLTGDVAPRAGKVPPTRLAHSSRKRNSPPVSAVSARKHAPGGRSAKSLLPAQKRRLNSRSNRPQLAKKTPTKTPTSPRLPISGASIASRPKVSVRKRGMARTPSYVAANRQPSALRRNTGQEKPGVSVARKKQSVPHRVATSLIDKPGAPTPPGLLASTRKKPVPKDEPAVDLHHVQPGDTFETLARAYYGSSRYVEFLMRANPNIDPSRMRVGTMVRIPALSSKKNRAATPASAAARGSRPSPMARRYEVQPGDSFYRIAEKQLGDAGRWKELFELNKNVVGRDPSRLKVGQVLTLPEK